MYWSHHHKSTNKKSSGLLTHYCLPVHIFSCPMNNIMNGKIGSWTLHLRMLYLECFIFGQLNLRAVTPSEISPSGCYIFGMFHPRDVSTSGINTFRNFTFGKLHLWTFPFRMSSETLEGVILRSCP